MNKKANKTAKKQSKKNQKSKEIKKKKITSSVSQKSKDDKLLNDIVEGEYGFILKMTQEWLKTNPLGTYDEIPDKLLDAWTSNFMKFTNGMKDKHNDSLLKAEEALQLAFLNGMFVAEFKRQGKIPPKDGVKHIELYENWIMILFWYSVMKKSQTPPSEVNGVVVFDPIFLAEFDKGPMRNKFIDDLENATELPLFLNQDDKLENEYGDEWEDELEDEEMDSLDLVYEAWESDDEEEKIALAKEAISLDPNCSDAYLLLTKYFAKTNAEKIMYCQQALDAGEKSIGKKFIKENKGHLWMCHEARGYMRAKHALAAILADEQRFDEATAHYDELLLLNKNDNQGVRYEYMGLLLQTNKLDRAEKLLAEYEEEGSSQWAFNRALFAYKKSGDDAKNLATIKLLKAAHKENKHVIKYLTNPSTVPDELPDSYSFGDKSEAIIYLLETKKAWMSTSGAIEWAKNILSK